MSEIIKKDDGSPFSTYQSAKAKRTRMGLQGLDTNIIEVDGGWALEKRPYRKPKKRIPLGQRNVLTVTKEDKDPNFEYRWVNDRDDRINMFRDAGWEVDTRREGLQTGDPNVGKDTGRAGTPVTKSVGGGKVAYLMKIPKEYYEEDQQAKAAKIDEMESDLKLEKDKKGRYGKIELSQK